MSKATVIFQVQSARVLPRLKTTIPATPNARKVISHSASTVDRQSNMYAFVRLVSMPAITGFPTVPVPARK